MARRLGSALNELKIHDNISNSSITLLFCTPSTVQVAAYSNKMNKRVKNKIVNCIGTNRQAFGLAILKGIGDGDFEKEAEGKPGEYVPIASDPKSPNYDPEWKEFVSKFAPDIVETLAVHAFENTADTDPDELDTAVGGDPVDPNPA